MRNRWLFLLFCITLLGCFVGCTPASHKIEWNGELLLDEENRYIGFEPFPEEYTPDMAEKDGCYVTIYETESGKIVRNEEKWEAFLETSAKGEDAFLRKAGFDESTGHFWLCDLYYVDGSYHYFDCEYEDLTDRPYRYLRKLYDFDLYRNQISAVYVLTDSLELTGRDVFHSLFSSTFVGVTDIPFTILQFAPVIEVEAKDYTDEQLLELVKTITSPTADCPGLSSNPYDYINAHIEEYAELVAGGTRVSDFFIARIRDSEHAGLDQYIMAAVCAEITGIGVGDEKQWGTSKEWLALYDEEIKK